MSSESVRQVARSLGRCGQFSHMFRSEVYDFYSVSLAYFEYTLVHGNITENMDFN
jgi:hypothetical protein